MMHLGVYLFFANLHWNLILLPKSERSPFICISIGKMSAVTYSDIISSRLSQLTLCGISIRSILEIIILFFPLISLFHFPANYLFSILTVSLDLSFSMLNLS